MNTTYMRTCLRYRQAGVCDERISDVSVLSDMIEFINGLKIYDIVKV